VGPGEGLVGALVLEQRAPAAPAPARPAQLPARPDHLPHTQVGQAVQAAAGLPPSPQGEGAVRGARGVEERVVEGVGGVVERLGGADDGAGPRDGSLQLGSEEFDPAVLP